MKNSYKLDSSFKIETKYSIGKSRCQYLDEKISTIKKLYSYVTNKKRVGSQNRGSKNAPEKESKGTKMKYEIVGSKFYSLVLSCTAHAAPHPHKRAQRRVFWLFRIRVLRVTSAPHGAR